MTKALSVKPGLIRKTLDRPGATAPYSPCGSITRTLDDGNAADARLSSITETKLDLPAPVDPTIAQWRLMRRSKSRVAGIPLVEAMFPIVRPVAPGARP